MNGLSADALKEISTDPQAEPEDANEQAGMGPKAKAKAVAQDKGRLKREAAAEDDAKNTKRLRSSKESNTD